MQTFSIQHFSPAGAYFIQEYLQEIKPKLILIEGPADFTPLIEDITDPKIKPPFAVMAYTEEAPVQTILYPFAEFSPEYQALLWGMRNRVNCRFCDLSSDIFLGISSMKLMERAKIEDREAESGEEESMDVYALLNEHTLDHDHEIFWERNLEQCKDLDTYLAASREFGRGIRELSLSNRNFMQAENLVREAYMRRVVFDALEEGYMLKDIVIITGAFHTEALRYLGESIDSEKDNAEADFSDILSDKQLGLLPRRASKTTLMPYSYYRLSERSGYGAGSRAPAYNELLWEGRKNKDLHRHVYHYLTGIAGFCREHGSIISSAEVIEAVRLSYTLAELRGGEYPSHADVKDAAITCMGHGSFSELSLGFAEADIGTKIGSIPPQSVQTSIQMDFYHRLLDLKLERFRTVVAQELVLDLRENLRVKSRDLAFLDLERSFFLHKLNALGIAFAKLIPLSRDASVWQEKWVLQWTPEAEIQIVESILKGDTIETAVSFSLTEKMQNIQKLSELAEVFQTAFHCGIPKQLHLALKKMDELTGEEISVQDIAATMNALHIALTYGDIRKLDLSPVQPLLEKLVIRLALRLPEESTCDSTAARLLAEDILLASPIVMQHENADQELWIRTISSLSVRDDVNTLISGLCMAILLDLGNADHVLLGNEVSKRLSKGMPADLGAGWFEGLSMKNHYSLILRQSLWEKLSEYTDSLDEEEFKRTLICLRRAFSSYDAQEKDQIAENLAELWGVLPQQVSELLNAEIPELTEETIASLDEFDFDF